MKLLITGGAGFIGQAVVKRALSDGHSIVNLDALTYAAIPSSLKDVKDHPSYTFEHADIRDVDALARIFAQYRPDAVMHLAAESHVDRSIDSPNVFVETNVIGTVNLLQAARAHWDGLDGEAKNAFRFHHISTDEVYGDLSPTDPAFTETTPYDPSSPYSASKAASDHFVRAWARTYRLPVLITNCSNNYGPYQYPEKLIPVVILKALSGQPIPVYGTGDNVRDWLYVDDHADALLTVLAKGEPGRTYNIGGDNERTNLELVKTICKIMDEVTDGSDHADLITFVADRPGHDRRYAIDPTRIRTELGWTPSISFDEGFERTVRWYLANRDWWLPLIDQGKFGNRLGAA